MPPPRSQVSREEVEQAIREIRAYYIQGRRILAHLAARSVSKKGAVREQALELGWNETRVRKSLQFARPVVGYDRKQLALLFQQLRQHRPVFGTAFVGLLVTVAWAEDRAEFQRRCIEENWSKSELEMEIKRRFGNRRFGGRRRLVVPERGHLLVQLEEMADTWRRWFSVVAASPGDAKKSIVDRHLEDLSDSIRGVNRAIGKLQEAVDGKLRVYRRRVRA